MVNRQVNDTELLKLQELIESALTSLADYGDVRQSIREPVRLQAMIIDLRESIKTSHEQNKEVGYGAR